ncbi:general transcriptional corepressor trfA-like [Cataglyphis hispanica]|uniref:general transcriptional corepressor trfA-like n=1 Tax=Cataglyphis hispanica TaxID=1086592 RepID=UPI00217F5F22|nr:general transcriptional corepressor trfA-like [Cataglyphis hispanica]
MRIELSARMEKRLSETPRQGLPSPSRKNKRRSNRRSNPLDTVLDTWANSPQNKQDGSLLSNVEYPTQMLWQSGVPQNVPGNGQRLFTAMSDPSVCGYSPLPLTYTMQPVSLPPMYRMYQPMPVPNVRTVHGRHRRHCNEHLTKTCPNANNNVVNGYGSLQENGRLEFTAHIAHQNGDYASLPSTANKDSGINSDELNSEQRRYSDPGLGPADNLPHTDNSDDSDSVESGSSITTISHSNKLVLSLIEQMTELKKCNSQLFKELNETKSNVENIKAKLAQCKHSALTDYQPGMLSGLISEIREANKNCEENLVTKVKTMLEERYHQQAKEMEELKNLLSKLTKEKEESDERVAKLEEELTALKLNATNEGREIAAFEEETLALRRELQEARASRTLAENHAAKCVNFAVSRSVTRVTFDTPCITSTPVRTALTDTCSLSPVLSPAISSSSSVLRSRSAEVAALLLVSEDANHRRNSESRSRDQDFSQPKDESDRCSETTSTLCQTTLTCSNEDTVKAIGIESQDKIGNQSSGLVNTVTRLDISTELKLKDYPVFSNRKEPYIVDTKSDGKAKLTVTEEEIEMRHLTADSLLSEEQTDDQLREKYANTEMTSAIEKDEARILVSPSVFEEEKNLLSDTTTSKVESSINHPSWQKTCTFRNQRGSFKKPRRRNSNLKRSFSETDKNPRQDTKVDMSRPSSDTIGASDTMSEDEGCCSRNDDRTSIIEVPDVAVVSGGSIMPKNLCSTRTPISRIQRAPSRATYTTAYI